MKAATSLAARLALLCAAMVIVARTALIESLVAASASADTAPGLADGQARATERPLIGVLTVPVEQDSRCVSRRRRRLREGAAAPSSCFSRYYVQWLESAGARAVPIRFDLPRDEIDRLLGSVNGLLFTGGDVPLREVRSEYMEVARHLYNRVLEINAGGEHFPLWGTCMGLQTLAVLVGGPEVLEFHIFSGVDPAMLPLRFTPAADTSALFGPRGTPAPLRRLFATENVTTNFHHDGVAPESFKTNAALAATFDVLSVNTDQHGRPFVSTIEARAAPIFGVQWHPERPQFEFYPLDKPDPVSHTLEAVACNAWTAMFFVDQARRNARRFESAEAEELALIDNLEGTQRKGSTYFFVDA